MDSVHIMGTLVAPKDTVVTVSKTVETVATNEYDFYIVLSICVAVVLVVLTVCITYGLTKICRKSKNR